MVVIQLALSKEQIDEVIGRSREIKRLTESKSSFSPRVRRQQALTA